MKTIEDPAVRASLIARLQRLTPAAERRWGRMDVLQMLVHMGRAMESVLRGEQFEAARSPSRLIKLLALKTPLSWPRGLPSGGDPAATEVDASRFEDERVRTIAALEAMAAADGASFTPDHPAFGPMTRKDWYRWAQRHLDHHLQQFGV